MVYYKIYAIFLIIENSEVLHSGPLIDETKICLEPCSTMRQFRHNITASTFTSSPSAL